MKKFIMTVIIKDDEIQINTKNQGLNPLEIIGALECKKDDIVRQMKYQLEFKRALVEDGKEFVITEEE